MRILTMLALCFPGVAAASSLVVDPNGSEFTDLQSAVDAAQDGDILYVSAGRYGDVTIGGDKHIEVVGEGEVILDSLVITGAGTEVTASKLIFKDSEFAVEVQEGALHLQQVEMTTVGSVDGGYAIAARPGTLVTVEDLDLRGGSGLNGVIVANAGSMLTITDAIIEDCGATDGGAIFSDGGTVVVENTSFSNNTASHYGGAIAAMSGAISLSSVSIDGGVAEEGGAVWVGPSASVSLSDVVLSGNVAYAGGHVAVGGGSLTGSRVVAREGAAARGGGFALVDGELSLTNALMVRHAEVAEGGAIHVSAGTLDLRYAVLYGNDAEIGAAVAMEGGDATFSGVIVASNRGEAIANVGSGTAFFDDGILWGNEDIAGTGGVIGVATGANVSLESPGFLAPAAGDFALATGSPGIDAGVMGEADLDGTPADIGIYGGLQAWALPDADGDGYTRGRDCDDGDPLVNEATADQWYDGIDSNCDRADDFDQDGDGFRHPEFGGRDCDDTDAAVFPGADEATGDKVDADCDGLYDPDEDGDGWSVGLDCDDTDPDVSPFAPDAWYDGVDSDCVGNSDFDRDGDGWDSAAFGGQDCDDRDGFINPGMAEVAGDDIDQDCDGADLEPDTGAEPEAVEPEQDEPADAADPFGGRDSNHMTTTGCSTTGGTGSGAGLLGLAGLALVALGRRRRD